MNTKHQLFLFIRLCVFFLPETNVSAQSYIPFPKDSANWIEDVYEECWHGTFQLKHYEYSYSGDTLINLKSYKKILLNGNGPCAGYGIVGALFDDTISRKVYFIPGGDSIEQTLYDFTLNVGDTISGYFGAGAINTITSIDTVNYGGITRRRFSYSGGWMYPYYIEGIGSATGLLENIDQYWINSTLLCFSINGTAIFPDSVTTCTLLPSSINENENSFEVIVFPNPFSESVKFIFEEGKADELIIMNISGTECRKYYIKDRQFVLNGKEFSSGIYFYIIKKENRIVSRGKLGVAH